MRRTTHGAREFAEQFRSPPAAFRGAPFWAWNDRLDQERLCRQIEWFREMGMGGFFMHPRTGLETEYLGEEFFACVNACAAKAADLGMHAWLYDEDRWPSGYAGGLLTRDDPSCRERYLLLTPRPYGPTPPGAIQPREWPLERNERGRLLARYDVVLDENGCLRDYRRLRPGDAAGADATLWYAYLEIQEPCAGWNHATLGDVLNPQTTRRFIELTHQQYARCVGAHFGTAVPGIFTDEPHFLHKECLQQAAGQTDLRLPFTDDLPDSYRQAFGDDLLDCLPEVLWELPQGTPSLTRRRFHDHLCDRLVDGFLKPIGAWCNAHGLALTGHLVEESTLAGQTQMNGDVMRGYPHMQIPGIDILHDGLELNSAKQCQSVVRQCGQTAMASELYGVTGWDVTFADFKAQGDWQAALGVTLRVHHLAWASMAGEAKRDYPGSISYQQPWWREFGLIEDHFARINVLMTRGRPMVNVGVIHPIESFWLCFGPEEQTGRERAAREQQFRDLTEWLLHGLIDFDFINESLLPGMPAGADLDTPRLKVGTMDYATVIVPGLRTLRATTLERLERFAGAGGRLLFLGEIPSLIDGQPSDRPARLARRCRCLPFKQPAILAAVDASRYFQAETPDDDAPPALLHQLREDDGRRLLFLCNTDRKRGRSRVQLRFPGRWTVTRRDTMTGESESLPASKDHGHTRIEWNFPPHGHLLLTLEPTGTDALPVEPRAYATARTCTARAVKIPPRVPVTLSEPNALPLDLARWRWNDAPWQPVEETLRIEDVLRQRLGMPLRRSHNAQPWCAAEPMSPSGRLTLEFDVNVACPVAAPRLVIEQPEQWRVSLDGTPVCAVDCGWWVDEAIRTVALPALEPGRRRLRLETDFNSRTALECCFLLGKFGVAVDGADLRITEPVKTLVWGDWTRQGLPFYTGNVTYRVEFHAPNAATWWLENLHFDNPLLRIRVDGQDAGAVAFAPYRCRLGRLAAGRHKLCLAAFGTRHNAFGPLHTAGPDAVRPSPAAWHPAAADWRAARNTLSKGILDSPTIRSDGC